MKFRHYSNSGSLSIRYIFGFNIYKDRVGWTIDVIVGKHVFAIIAGGEK